MFDPNRYWRNLVVGGTPLDVGEVGHPDMGHEFNRLAYDLRTEALVRALHSVGKFPPREPVFEAGYGVGYYLRFWRRYGVHRATGVDLSERAWRNVRRGFPEYDLRVGDLAELQQWPDWERLVSTFNLVTALDVVYHIVNDEAARRAVDGLGQLVAPDGILLLTEKFPAGAIPFQVSPHAVTRPLTWYQSVLRDHNLAFVRIVPIFWCMDPPAKDRRRTWSSRIAYCCWGAMRVSVKFWPRESRGQRVMGRAAGIVGKALDHLMVPRLPEHANLVIAVFQRQ